MYRKFDSKLNSEVVVIYPGEYHISSKDLFIYTVLGSCISVCLYDVRQKIGGMNHFMLSGIQDAETMSQDNFLNQSTRYGMAAMEVLINDIFKQGGKKNFFRAKVFGGSKMIKIKNISNSVAENNISFVQWFLKAEGIPIEAIDVGGVSARKVYFNPFTGKVYMKKIIPTVEDLAEEIAYENESAKASAAQKKDEGSIELF